MKFPRVIQDLIDDFSDLPTVGPKTAQRYAFYLLKQPQDKLERVAKHIYDLREGLKICKSCMSIAENNPCLICSSKDRDKTTLCIVSTQGEMIAIEKTKKYNGLYFVLGKNIRPQDGIDNDNNKISVKKLIEKIKSEYIKEIILALSPTIEGETTGMYLQRLLKPFKIKTTRLARGLPMGSDIEYADEITLNNALKNRKEI